MGSEMCIRDRGRAIARQPQVFLLDEPLSNLDAQLRDDTRAELKQLHDRLGITTIYVTHDQVEAMTLADRIVVLNRGRIQQIGEPQSIYAYPANRMVATFLGNPPMNILPAIYTGNSFQLGEQILFCPKAIRDKLQLVQGQGFDLGIRPEYVYISEPQRRSGKSERRFPPIITFQERERTEEEEAFELVVEVRVVEPLGREILVRAGLLGTGVPFNVQASPDVRLRPGDRISLSLDMNQLFVFDSTTGDALYP